MAQQKGLISRDDLRHYENWVGNSAQLLLESAIAAGGWTQVFKYALPVFASRVRQYFNVTPTSLTLCDETTSASRIASTTAKAFAAANAELARVARDSAVTMISPGGTADLIIDLELGKKEMPSAPLGTLLALSGDVYVDERQRVWYQMSPGGTVYHWDSPAKPENATLAAGYATRLGQAKIPVFKLVCPDRTGGSRECVIFNRQNRQTICAVNETVNVTDLIEKHRVKQGSYNYAETIKRGLKDHQRLDVDSDPMAMNWFLETAGPLSSRIFKSFSTTPEDARSPWWFT